MNLHIKIILQRIENHNKLLFSEHWDNPVLLFSIDKTRYYIQLYHKHL